MHMKKRYWAAAQILLIGALALAWFGNPYGVRDSIERNETFFWLLLAAQGCVAVIYLLITRKSME